MALVSAWYDVALGLPLLLAPVAVARMFGAPDPVPVVNAQLNGLFTLTLALGYFWAARDLPARSGYLWVAGVFAKALGCALFVADHFLRASPATYLVFAACDGSLAVWTFVALRADGRSRPGVALPKP